MESKIPLPTDNIYKFYALFGLLLLITSIIGVVIVSTSTNEKLYELVKEYESIQKPEVEEDESTLGKVIEKRIEVQISNKTLFIRGLGVFMGISILLMIYGFVRWHTKIQPKQDEYFELQIQKLRAELESSNK